MNKTEKTIEEALTETMQPIVDTANKIIRNLNRRLDTLEYTEEPTRFFNGFRPSRNYPESLDPNCA